MPVALENKLPRLYLENDCQSNLGHSSATLSMASIVISMSLMKAKDRTGQVMNQWPKPDSALENLEYGQA